MSDGRWAWKAIPRLLLPEDFADAYARWAAGDCPCCGGALVESVNNVPLAAIGEGVVMCGRCIENEHHLSADDFVPMMLMAIAKRVSHRPLREVEEG